MKAFTAVMMILLTAGSMWLVVEVLELRKRNMTLAIQMDGFKSQQQFFIDHNRELLRQLREKPVNTIDLLHRGGGEIEYTRPVYVLPEAGK